MTYNMIEKIRNYVGNKTIVAYSLMSLSIPFVSGCLPEVGPNSSNNQFQKAKVYSSSNNILVGEAEVGQKIINHFKSVYGINLSFNNKKEAIAVIDKNGERKGFIPDLILNNRGFGIEISPNNPVEGEDVAPSWLKQDMGTIRIYQDNITERNLEAKL